MKAAGNGRNGPHGPVRGATTHPHTEGSTTTETTTTPTLAQQIETLNHEYSLAAIVDESIWQMRVKGITETAIRDFLVDLASQLTAR